MSKIGENITGGDTAYMLHIRPFWINPHFVWVSDCCYGYCNNSVIGGFSWVHLIWLANVIVWLQATVRLQPTVWLQPYTMIKEK